VALLVATAAGTVGGIALAQSPLLAWPPVDQALLGLAGGLAMLLFWSIHAHALAQGHQAHARKMRVRFGIAFGGLAAIAGLTFLPSGRYWGMFGPLASDRLAAYDRLGRLMARAYPYFQEKDVDWPALLAAYRPRVMEADSDDAYARALGELLLALNDAHTGVTTPWADTRCCFALTQKIEGQAVVTVAGSRAREAGLVRGAVVRSVDGLAVSDALERVHPALRGGSTPWQRRYRAYAYLLSTTRDAEGLTVTYKAPDGVERTVTLRWDAPAPPGDATSDEGPIVTGERLPSGVGLIRVPTLVSRPRHDLVAEFDAALDPLLDASALILDLRGNGGGDSSLGERMAGRLLPEPYAYGAYVFRTRMPQHLWAARFDVEALPRTPTYDGPVAVLIDTGVMSSAEDILAALVDSGRVITVGRRTAGSSGNPVSVRMPGGVHVRYSTGTMLRADGTPIEGRGFAPDVAVNWTVEDVRQDRDPDIAAAEGHLLDAASP